MMTMSDIHQLDPTDPNNRADHDAKHVQQVVIVGIAGPA